MRTKKNQNKRAAKRTTLYRQMFEKYGGRVPCFVCGEHVRKDDATLEHILPRSKGGTLARENIAISHGKCNQARGTEDFLVSRAPFGRRK